jgi:hypothetical protein
VQNFGFVAFEDPNVAQKILDNRVSITRLKCHSLDLVNDEVYLGTCVMFAAYHVQGSPFECGGEEGSRRTLGGL